MNTLMLIDGFIWGLSMGLWFLSFGALIYRVLTNQDWTKQFILIQFSTILATIGMAIELLTGS